MAEQTPAPARPAPQPAPQLASITPPTTPFHSAAEFYAWALGVLELVGRLTPAEVRVCEPLMLGRRYVDIAQMGSISPETVRWHVKRILRKLDAETVREFILVLGRSIDELGEPPAPPD